MSARIETPQVLEFRWTISRGRDTYGYNICSLWIRDRKVSSCNGGGYDMKGTALAEWMVKELQPELLKLKGKAHTRYLVKNGKYEHKKSLNPEFYGMTTVINFDKKETYINLDGACGFSSMERILAAIGYKVRGIVHKTNLQIYELNRTG